MPKKIGPYLFIGILILILVFILGLRYGQNVEKTNKTINYLISLAPTKATPSEIPLEFKKFFHQGCGVSFLYPNSYKVISESSESALLMASKKDLGLELDCSKDGKYIQVLKDNKIASEEIKILNRTLKAKKTSENVGDDQLKEALVFPLTNYVKGKTVYFHIHKSLFPLFEKSLNLQ